ncbi:pectate lyase [Gilvimarinus agarilyticus]|uniref:pectate lyase n=1 Tax=Gilvimarinus agarilyticus TaxID=679259 RepID=UPI000698F26F|nr:pectate lyase [Gilvimarinus agarilyticus]
MHRLIALSLLLCSPLPILAATGQSLPEYRALSQSLALADQHAFAQELTAAGREQALPAPATKRFGFDPNAPDEFFHSAEARRIADIILSYQTPSGGWSKRTDMGHAPRQPGQMLGVEEHYIPTFDNGATTTQIWFLARTYSAQPEPLYAQSVEQAIALIIKAQYPAGGWPQNFPLTGGYHDYITYNDEAMGKLLQVIESAANRRAPLQFISPELASQAQHSLNQGIQAVLDTQVIVEGKRTIWGAQHDAETLAPINARKFEPVALATAESADLVEFLMSLETPSASLKQAIVAAHDWFVANRIYGYSWQKDQDGHNALVSKDGAGPLWGRFCEIGSNRPVVGDRDGSVHYDVMAISQERRDGYAWYTNNPKDVLKHFPKWREQHLP